MHPCPPKLARRRGCNQTMSAPQHDLHAVRQLGFRRWYERQLIEGHAWFVTTFVSMILVAIAIEAFDSRDTMLGGIGLIALALGGGALGALAFVRYKRILESAERLAECAICAHCSEYGRFTVLEACSTKPVQWLRVRCRNCGHEWTLR